MKMHPGLPVGPGQGPRTIPNPKDHILDLNKGAAPGVKHGQKIPGIPEFLKRFKFDETSNPIGPVVEAANKILQTVKNDYEIWKELSYQPFIETLKKGFNSTEDVLSALEKTGFLKKIQNEVSEVFDFSNLSVFDVAIFLSLFLMVIPDANAESSIRKAIQKGEINFSQEFNDAFELVKKISQMDYLVYKNEARGVAPDSQMFEEIDINILTWNLYHEARGENTEGQLGVLLSTLNRMKHRAFPTSVGGVVFQKYAYSWSLAIQKLSLILENTNDQAEQLNSRQIKLEKYDHNKFLQIKRLVESFVNEKNSLGDTIRKVENTLSAQSKISARRLSEIKFNTYHKLGMLTMKSFIKEVKTANTFRRIAYLEYLYNVKNDPRILRFDTHIFYNVEDPGLDADTQHWEMPDEYLKLSDGSGLSLEEKKFLKYGKPKK